MNFMKKALITGASRGLGLSLVKRYLEAGFQVFAGVRNANSAQFRAVLGDHPDTLVPIIMDVSDDASVRSAAQQVSGLTDSLDVIISNAGVHLSDSDNKLAEINMDQILQTFNVNTLGPLRIARYFVPLLEKGGVKALVNISSDAGSVSITRHRAWYDYCMSKAALNMESKILRNDLSERGIKVFAIHPGWMRTDMGGAEADIASEEAASGILHTVEKYAALENPPMYMDYTGKVMEY